MNELPSFSLMYNATCHGQAPFSARSPPTMRVEISAPSAATRGSVALALSPLPAARDAATHDMPITTDKTIEAILVMLTLPYCNCGAIMEP
jgi:hypothetical protein